MKKDKWVVCVNDANWFHPKFELTVGKAYLVHDVKASPSLFGRNNLKFIFLADDGEQVEISSRRFKIDRE